MMQGKIRGYTLLELALGLVVLGGIAVAVVRFGFVANQKLEQIASPQTLIVADNALVGFIAAKHRLPCPDTRGDGVEHCGGALVGQLPYKTLGLARADMMRVRYGAFVKSDADAGKDINLTSAQNRFKPWLTKISTSSGVAPEGELTDLEEINGIDFCHALRLGNALPRVTSATKPEDILGIESKIDSNIHVRDANKKILKNVAYGLSLPSVKSDPATNINTMYNAFAAPSNPLVVGAQDTVITMDFAQISDRLSCSGVLASASHAHPNVASAAAIMYGAMLDYKVQLDLQLEMSELAVLSGGVAVASAIGEVSAAASTTLTAISIATSSFGVWSWSIGLAATSTVLAAASVVSAGISLDLTIKSRDNAKKLVNDFSNANIVKDAEILAKDIRAHAKASDAAGIYR
ncbi:MAG: hypothetical protein HY253_07395 [Burkholderiales bacterium]|nr:hypothetical protein [Burkholderiales bacterium]